MKWGRMANTAWPALRCSGASIERHESLFVECGPGPGARRGPVAGLAGAPRPRQRVDGRPGLSRPRTALRTCRRALSAGRCPMGTLACICRRGMRATRARAPRAREQREHAPRLAGPMDRLRRDPAAPRAPGRLRRVPLPRPVRSERCVVSGYDLDRPDEQQRRGSAPPPRGPRRGRSPRAEGHADRRSWPSSTRRGRRGRLRRAALRHHGDHAPHAARGRSAARLPPALRAPRRRRRRASSRGSLVREGDVVGFVGDTGSPGRVHLHLEARRVRDRGGPRRSWRRRRLRTARAASSATRATCCPFAELLAPCSRLCIRGLAHTAPAPRANMGSSLVSHSATAGHSLHGSDAAAAPDPALGGRVDPMLGRVLAGRFTILVEARRRLDGHGLPREAGAHRPRGRDQDPAQRRALDEASRARFLREARANSLLTSPHTVTVFDFGAERRTASSTSRWSCSRASRSASASSASGRIAVGEAIDTARQALRSLAEAHAKGIIHRDLKPDNLFFARVRTRTRRTRRSSRSSTSASPRCSAPTTSSR